MFDDVVEFGIDFFEGLVENAGPLQRGGREMCGSSRIWE